MSLITTGRKINAKYIKFSVPFRVLCCEGLVSVSYIDIGKYGVDNIELVHEG